MNQIRICREQKGGLNCLSLTDKVPWERGRRESDLQPILEGELIKIRSLLLSDFDDLYTAASGPLIWEQHPQTDGYKRDVFEEFFDSAIVSRGAFVVIDKHAGRIVVSSRYCNLKLQESEVEIGCTFLERVRLRRV